MDELIDIPLSMKEKMCEEFEAELRTLLKKWNVTLTATDRMVGYDSPFADKWLSHNEYFSHDTKGEDVF